MRILIFPIMIDVKMKIDMTNVRIIYSSLDP